MKGRIPALLVITFVAVALLWLNRPATLPSYFDKTLSYEAALEQSGRTGKPVFAYASADWCEPCREFKRTTLRDPRVAEWLASRTIPVYLDVTSESRPGAAAAAALRVTSIPAIFLIREGEPVGSHAGAIDADSLLNWLETFAAAPTTPAG